MSVNIQPTQWGSLADIHEVEPLTQKDAECFREVQDVLRSYGLLHKFGLALLHKHFDLDENEVVMEETQRNARKQTLSVMSLNDVPEDTVPTIWKLTESGDAVNVCRCYGKPHGMC